MRRLLFLLGVVLVLGGLILLPRNQPLGFLVIVLGLLLVILSLFLGVEDGGEWRALRDFDPNTQRKVLNQARETAGLISIQNVTYAKVAPSHTHAINVLGTDERGTQIMVGVDPVTFELIKMVRLCPRGVEEALEVEIAEDEAMAQCQRFLQTNRVTLPEDFVLDETGIASLGPWKRWRFIWRHYQNDVQILPDFIMLEVNAATNAEVISFAKVEHAVSVSLEPQLELQEAGKMASKALPELDGREPSEGRLAVVYPNNMFEKQNWEWVDEQALCWILKYFIEGRHFMDVWVDAVTGAIHGGVMCHTPATESYAIDSPSGIHMKAHLEKVWSPYLGAMNFYVSNFHISNTAAGFPESTIANSIANSRYFIVEGHGDVTETAEMMLIAYQGSQDQYRFTPDEVPPNILRLAFLDTCQSGEDGTGLDFKDTFISQGADVFIGFDAYMCAWDYEERLLYYSALGIHLANAHTLAYADLVVTYPIVITYDVSCLNRVRLAPLDVTVVKTPSGNLSLGDSLIINAIINNREDVDREAATNVHAELILPPGFTITSGANPQNIGTVSWLNPRIVTWHVTVPNTIGIYVLDINVWSDNLGVAVDDPDDPYRKFVVAVIPTCQSLCENVFRFLPYRRSIF